MTTAGASNNQNDSDASTSAVPPPQIYLSRDALIHVFETVCKYSPLSNVLDLRLVNRLANETVNRAATRKMSELKIEIGEPIRFKIVGLKMKELPEPEPVIYIQNLRFKHTDAPVFLHYLLSHMDKLSSLTVHIQSTEANDLTILEGLLDQILDSNRVKLSDLQIRRRKGGQRISRFVELVKKNASSLKTIKGLGITEAAESFSEKISLSRLSLMTHDVGLASEDTIYDNLIEISSSGARFSHLSYTSFIGLDPTDDIVQAFLEKCEVSSLRMTMLRGPLVPHDANFIFGKVRGIKSLQLGEVVEKPNIYNRLIVYEPLFKKVFPYVDEINFFQQWN